LTLYQDQYPIFGDAQVMPLKVIWDYTYYWALLAPVFFGERLTSIQLLGRLRDAFAQGRALNLAMQALLRTWYERNAAELVPDRRFLNQWAIDWFHEMNRALNDTLDDAAFEARLRANVDRMRWLAAEMLAQARRDHPAIGDQGLDALLAPYAAFDRDAPPCLDDAWYASAPTHTRPLAEELAP
jgi:hypothetical protein